MAGEESLKKQIEKLEAQLEKKQRENTVLRAIYHALNKLKEKRLSKEDEGKLADLENQLNSL